MRGLEKTPVLLRRRRMPLLLTSLSLSQATLKRSSHLGMLLQFQALWSVIKQQAGGAASRVALVKSLFNLGEERQVYLASPAP